MINKVEIVNEVLDFLANNKNVENKFVNYGAIIKNIKEKYFEKTDEHVISKRELIQIIIEMQIKDLEKVEAIFNAFDYKNGLTTEHDIALKLFVEKDVYDGSMPNDFVNENFLDDYEYCDDEIQNNHCKLDLIIKKIVDSNFSNINFNSYKADNCENFLYSLISSTMTPSEFDIKESCEKELEELRRYFGEYEAQFIDRDKNSENSNKKNRTAIEMDDFIKIVIMTFVKNYYSSDTKSFRVVIDDMNKNILSINGVTHERTYASFQCDYSLYLCAINNAGSAGFFSNLRLYYCKIYDNGTLIRDYIPVLDWDDVPCLYDKVKRKLYYNAGTGSFTYA